MTADERRAMRELLRTALQTAVLPGATDVPPGGFHRTDGPEATLLARFTAELTTVGGTVHEPAAPDASTLAALIAQIVPASAGRGVLMWDEPWLPVPGLAAALAAEGFVVATQQPDDLASLDGRATLAGATVGITGVEAALAETGSLVLVSGPGRGRLASLLPPVHVALVPRTALVRSLPDLLNQRPELATAGSNLVCITGPSRTADIEHTLSRGVHGPKEVHVVLI